MQTRTNIDTTPFVLHGVAAGKHDAVIKQDAGRSAALERYTVMGESLVAAGSVTPDGGNTGDGTVTGFALAVGPTPLVGDYNLECTFAVANGGVFKLEDPNGNLVADNITLRVGAGLATTVIAAGLTFVITDGATDFAAGDKFALAISAVNKYLPLDLTAVDGLQIPKAVYTGNAIAAADIVAGDVEIPVEIKDEAGDTVTRAYIIMYVSKRNGKSQ